MDAGFVTQNENWGRAGDAKLRILAQKRKSSKWLISRGLPD
jgi:hypothetical protein